MAIDQDNVTKILSALSHPLRREILETLRNKQESSFTDLMNELKVDTGKLSFHLKNLEVFLEQTSTGKYRLSKTGENAVALIKDLEAWSVNVEIARRTSLLPLASVKKRIAAFLIDLGIAFGLFLALPNVVSTLTAQGTLLNFNLILFLLLLWMYLTLLEGFAGQTLGKRIVGLKVVRTDGKNLSYDHAAVRNFGVAFLLPFDLIYGIWHKDPKYIRYFDKFSGTTVVDLRPPTPTIVETIAQPAQPVQTPQPDKPSKPST